MGYGLGIDVGTAFTAAAIATGGRVEPLALGRRGLAAPSVVFVAANDEVAVGDAAERRGAASPHLVARLFKRRLGDGVPYVLGTRPVAAEDLYGWLLRSVLDAAREQQGGAADTAVVTHPAGWSGHRLAALQRALEVAGARGAQLVPEPVAAAVHYGTERHVPDGSWVAVYDLGGGTFDATLLYRHPQGFGVVGQPVGINDVGGADLDDAAFDLALRAAGLDPGALADEDPTDVARLRAECVEAKEALSYDTRATVSVRLARLRADVVVTRGELEQVARPLLQPTAVALRRLVEVNGLVPSQLTSVLLVGGTSRMPLVSEVVEAELGVRCAVDTQPKLAVALGAAIVARDALAASAAVRAAPAPVPTPAPAPTADATVAPAAAVEPPEPSPLHLRPRVPQPGHRSRAAMVAGAAAVLVAVVAAGFRLIGGGSDGTDAVSFPTEVEAELIGSLPNATTRDCERGAPDDDAVAAVVCDVADVGVVELRTFVDDAAMGAAFDDDRIARDAATSSDCAVLPGVRHAYEARSTAGEVACGTSGRSVEFIWTDEAAAALGSLRAADHAAAYDAWATTVGREAVDLTDAAESSLQGFIPDAPYAGCAGSESQMVLEGVVGAVRCVSTDSATTVTYVALRDVDSLRRAYADVLAVAGLATGDRADSAPTCPFETTGSIHSTVRGRLSCFAHQGRGTVAWTDEALLILGVGVRQDADAQAAVDLWQSGVGPFQAFSLTTGQLQVTLTWASNADLDLSVTDPTGAVVSRSTTNIPSGGHFDQDGNRDCRRTGSVENVGWTQQPPPGVYTVTVHGFGVDGECGAGDYTVRVRIADREDQVFSGTVGDDQTATHQFTF